MDSDLINRDEAIEIVRSLQVTLGGKEILHPEAKKSVLNALDDIPAVEAEPVRHGHWVYYVQNVYECSECKKTTAIFSGSRKYCPHCGARMDAEVKE